MKKQNQINQKTCILCGRIGLIVLFLIGMIVGIIIKPGDVHHSAMTREQCQTIYERMDTSIKFADYDKYEKLNNIFAKNCSGFVFEKTSETEEFAEKTPETTCGKIEFLLQERLAPSDSDNPEYHVDNAKIYANLSETGCAENSQKYKQLAKQELEIARALNDDNIANSESVEIVETYKRLQMQQEAEKMIEKAKKLTNPAIDFIIQLEKIIEE